jgi:protein-export membrane protein SecD/preprotein translocase SecF subunit
VASTNVPRPWRPLALLTLLLILVFVGALVLASSWAPRLGLDLQGGTSITLSAQTVDGQEPSQESLDEAVAIIRQRVNGSGVAEAEVSTQGTDTIIVQVPGVGQDEVVALVGQTAELQFRPVQAVVPGGSPAPEPTAEPTPTPTDQATGQPTSEPTPAAEPTDEATGDSASLGQRGDSDERVSRAQTREPLAAATAPAQASPAAEPTEADATATEQPDTTATEQPPPGDATVAPDDIAALASFDCASIEPGQVAPADQTLITCDRELANRYLLGPADVVGTDIAAATAGIPQGGVAWQVNLEFTGEGADAFFDSTQRLSQQQPPQNQFAIVLDGLVVSAPQVNEAIPGGRAQITGSFTQDEATALANVLQYGALPLAFETSDVTAVSPTLGTDQLQAGLVAGAIGLALVMLYSLLYYRGLGLVVIASLLVAGALTYGLVVLLGETIGFTLTLAGVAGLIVAIGITADSFVVLFERIRDEVREGRSVRMAVETGWLRARRTVIASDVVSLLAAFFLYVFSVGNVRGFAFALGLTTLVDLVVVFLFTKPVLTLLVRTRFFGQGHRLSGLDAARLGTSGAASSRGLVGLGNRLYRGEKSFPIVGNSRRWYAISAGLLAVAVLGLLVNGLTLGVEFRGGAELTAAVPGVSESAVGPTRDAVADSGVEGASDPRVTLVGEDRVRVQTGALTPQETAQVRDAVAEALDVGSDDITVQVVGPSWGAEITAKALQGLGLFLVAVVIYLAVAFEPKMGIAAIAALAHDVLATVGIYAWTGFDVTPASVIGFLTILGYSLYDTVVVFDKVRENTRGITGQSAYTYSEAANLAVNQTLARSINTSIIALLPIASILVVSVVYLGTGTLKDLALALFIGVAVGTYSSIFIATPLLADLKEREPVMRSLRQRVLARRRGPRGPAEPGAVSESVAAAVGAQRSEPTSSVGGEGAPSTVRGSTRSRPGAVVESGERQQPRRQSRADRRKGPSKHERPG